MKLRKLLLTFIILSFELFALCSLFVALVGEPSSSADAESNSYTEFIKDFTANQSPVDYLSKVDKIVFIIIDAMRVDFVSQMKFVENLLNERKSACIFKVSLDGPTVTLPRVKALVSGATSSYWDILVNLKQSSSISNDNFIWRANAADKRIAFYGDDTWLKLFSGNEFTRREGVTSFFVTDFYEVDTNVTRNVDKELEKMDFDMMILHYLGVDHVGHVHGPHHPLIPSKLDEMNTIVEKIFTRLLTAESNLPHVIFVTGDHGMANLGGHGGDSLPEVTTPLITMTVKSMQGQHNIQTCTPHEPNSNWKESPYNLKQVDIASTISYLWGLPFPKHSRGLVPLEILQESPLHSQFDLLLYSVKHLSKFLSEGKESHKVLLQKVEEFLIENSNIKINHTVISDYQKLLLEIRSAAVQDSNQDILWMLFSSLLLLQSVPLLVAVHYNEISVSTKSAVFSIICLIISFYATSLVTMINAIIFFFLLKQVCSSSKLAIIRQWIIRIPSRIDNSVLVTSLSLMSSILYLSSSFVEEEHFAIYFLYSSVILLSVICTYNKTYTTVINFLLILVMHRFCANLNATGQKWNYLPDLNELLSEYRLTSIVAFLAAVLIFVRMDSSIEKISIAVIAAFKLRLINYIVEWDHSLEHWEGKLCYAFILASFIVGMLTRNNNTVANVWILLSSLLQRTENIILIPLVTYQVKFIRLNFSQNESKFAVVLINFLFFCSFFYQGNSNNVTTIDISLGYTGLSTYNEYIVGTLTFISTFSLSILVIILSSSSDSSDYLNSGSSVKFSKSLNVRNSHFVTNVIKSLVVKISVTNFVFSIVLILMRQHLFIWSVFVPKLLCLIAFQILVLITVVVFIIDSCILQFPYQMQSKRISVYKSS